MAGRILFNPRSERESRSASAVTSGRVTLTSRRRICRNTGKSRDQQVVAFEHRGSKEILRKSSSAANLFAESESIRSCNPLSIN